MSSRRRLKAYFTLDALRLSDRHFLAKAKGAMIALGEQRRFDAIRAAHWRHKNGLEQRLLVALLNAPGVRKEALALISPSDFLTPAYAALAAVLLSPGGEEAARLGAEAIAGRPYLPDSSSHDWAAEARDGLARISERRERWQARRR